MKKILNLTKGSLLITTLLLSFLANSQETKKTSVKGFADGYLKLDSGRLHNNSKTAFTKAHNSFEISSVNLQAEHSEGNMKFYADLGLGNRINTVNTNDGNSTAKIIKELYISYDITSELNATFGVFQRSFGIEKVNSIENNNFSMSYSFSISPLYNTGAKLNYKASNFNFLVGASNAADHKSALNLSDNRKTIFAQIGYKKDNSDISLNYQASRLNPVQKNINQKNYNLLNLTLKQKINNELSLALDGNYYVLHDNMKSNNNEIYSIAGYVNYNIKENMKVSYRAEFLNDKNGVTKFNLNKGNVISNTVTGSYKIGNLNLVPEFRVDASSEKSFILDKKASKINAFALIAAIYSF